MGEMPDRERSPLPMVTVVIPTRNRREMLQAGLESLLRQSYPKDRYEIIVVDNGSTDGTEEMVMGVQANSNGLVRYFRQENLGPAVARNRGIQEGKGEIVAFTDSDCIAHSDWLEAGVDALLQDGKLGLISGRVLPMPGKAVTFLTRTVQQEREGETYPTCNIFYRKEALDRVGDFDAFFRQHKHYKDIPLGGEDTELAWRVKRAGWKSTFASEALVYHEVTRITAMEKLLCEPGRCRIMPYLVREIPELRTSMFLRYFACKETALFDLAVVGLLLAALIHPVFVLLSLPFPLRLSWVLKQGGSKRLLKFGFAHLFFATSVWYLAYGSVKYRSLLL